MTGIKIGRLSQNQKEVERNGENSISKGEREWMVSLEVNTGQEGI